MDATKGYGRLLGTLNFTETKHAAISVEDLTMATLLFRGGVATHGRRAGRSRAYMAAQQLGRAAHLVCD